MDIADSPVGSYPHRSELPGTAMVPSALFGPRERRFDAKLKGKKRRSSTDVLVSGFWEALYRGNTANQSIFESRQRRCSFVDLDRGLSRITGRIAADQRDRVRTRLDGAGVPCIGD